LLRQAGLKLVRSRSGPRRVLRGRVRSCFRLRLVLSELARWNGVAHGFARLRVSSFAHRSTQTHPQRRKAAFLGAVARPLPYQRAPLKGCLGKCHSVNSWLTNRERWLLFGTPIERQFISAPKGSCSLFEQFGAAPGRGGQGGRRALPSSLTQFLRGFLWPRRRICAATSGDSSAALVAAMPEPPIPSRHPYVLDLPRSSGAPGFTRWL
jgi:hypothetical protein